MLIAVYGALRKGCRLNPMLGYRAKFVGTDRLFGYDMYHNGQFPYILSSAMEDGKNNSVLVEVWDVTTEPAIDVIRLECSAGYELKTAETKYGVVGLFVDKDNRHRNLTRILNGDWIDWCQKYHNQDPDFYNERNKTCED